jgi:hypothetical protein
LKKGIAYTEILRRYDLLCFEGISLMLNIFLGRKPLPNYRLVEPAGGELQKIIVKEDVSDSLQDLPELCVHVLTRHDSDDEN